MHANIQLPPLYSISMTMQEEIDIFYLFNSILSVNALLAKRRGKSFP